MSEAICTLPSLPIELLDLILLHVRDDGPTLARTARASRSFHPIAISHLYRSIALDSEHKVLAFKHAPSSAAKYAQDISINLGRALGWDYYPALVAALVSLVKFCALGPIIWAIQAPLDILCEIVVRKSDADLEPLTHISILCPLAVFWEPVLDNASRLGFGNGGFDAYFRRLALRQPLRVTHLHMASSAALSGLDVFYNEERDRSAEYNPFAHVTQFSYDEPAYWESYGVYISSYNAMAGWHRHLPALEAMTCRIPTSLASFSSPHSPPLEEPVKLASWRDQRLCVRHVQNVIVRRDPLGIKCAVEAWQRHMLGQESLWAHDQPVWSPSSSSD